MPTRDRCASQCGVWAGGLHSRASDMELIMPTLTPDERRSLMYQHRYAAGQHVSYAEHGPRGPWKGEHAIVALLPHGADEPQYRISHADQSYDRVVWEHELTEDLGARERGQ